MNSHIGEKPSHPFGLAPLAGISDSAFRTVCRRRGAAFSCTEMVSAKGLYYKNPGSEELLKIRPEEGPVGIQIFGGDPDMISFAAGMLKDRGNAFIDINMGCPVPKVVKNGEGAALLKKPGLAAELVRAAAGASEKPVTVKMRIGFAFGDGTDWEGFALKMQEAGASALAVHPRTREQYYSGKADWEAIRRIKRLLDIPVIGSGDVFCAEDGMRMLERTGCDLVMVGRGALGNPWIFRELEAAYCGRVIPQKPEPEEIIATLKEHALLLLEDKDESRAVKEMRKHAAWYTKGIRGAAVLRSKVCSARSFREMFEIIEGLKGMS